MKSTKTKLISSVTVLLICFAMLIGSTFAWFTDSASTGVNKIQAGNLDVELSVWNEATNSYVSVSETTRLFDKVDSDKWEPGVVAYEKFKVENKGNLAFDYTLSFLPANVTYVNNKSLLDVIKVYEIAGDVTITDRDDLLNKISSVTKADINIYSQNNVRMNQNDVKYFTIVLYWEPTANDNAYNLTENHLKADLGIELVAKQASVESDSFDNNYDASAIYPITASVNIDSTMVEADHTTNAPLVAETSLKDANNNPVAKVTIPEGTKIVDNATKLTLSVNETSTPSGVTISSTSNSKTLEIKVDGLAASNSGLLKVETNIGSGLGDITLQHVLDGTSSSMKKLDSLSESELDEDQEYFYNNTTGMLTFLSSKFSPFVIEYSKDSWAKHVAGSFTKTIGDVTYITNERELALFAKQVNESEKAQCFSGKTFILDADLDMSQYLWEPIGQTGHGQFAGTFDGNNHTIKNLYINNKDKSGDCATGLFGWLNNATVMKLTIDGADVTGHHNVGVVAGYMETSGCTIENVHVSNATVSCASVNNDANGDKCGGIVGFANNDGTMVISCTVTNSTISAGRDAGQIVGYAKESNIDNCSADNVTVTTNGTSTGNNIRNQVIGRVD